MKKVEELDEFVALISERELSESEAQEFRELLKENPEALDRYLDHCALDTWLTASQDDFPASLTGAVRELGGSPVATRKPSRKAHAGTWALGGSIAAAIALIASFGGGADEETELADLESEQRESVPVVESAPAPKEAAASEPILLASVTEGPDGVDQWKSIQSTGSVQHPSLKEKPPVAVSAQDEIKFNRDIRSILSETCFHCHGPDEHGRRADLRMDTLEGATMDLGGTIAIVPGDVEGSEAWWRIISDDPDELMPPPESHLVLTDEQKDLIRRWIEQGAPYEGHWAYEQPERATPGSKVAESNVIDGFIHDRLLQEGLDFTEEAAPETLIRRLTFDLTGLPPTRAEVDSFVLAYQEDSEATWQRAIDRLLASPHFGERMAVPWLDQARYADTNGYSIDGGRHMWLWRDWVIQAYNENMPFDQFLTEQVAGDLLPDATPQQIVATGFNRNHMITHEGGTIPEENLTNYTADRVKTTSEVFLGLTMSCAQCHDHKYDPISIKEYYEFFAFFNELSDKGLDGNAGVNAKPNFNAVTNVPKDEIGALQEEIAALRNTLENTSEGFENWLSQVKSEERRLGEQFASFPMELLDVSAPNRPGPFEMQEDNSVLLAEPNKAGRAAMSHSLKLPADQMINGIRVRFHPYGESGKISHFDGEMPKLTTVLASAGSQPSKQVEFHNEIIFNRVTASSFQPQHEPAHVLDQRNIGWWTPSLDDKAPILNISFAEPIDTRENPYLSVLLFYGTARAIAYHWSIEAFSGVDETSRFDPIISSLIAKAPEEWTAEERASLMEVFRSEAPQLERERIRLANLEDRLKVLTEPHNTLVMDTAPKPRSTFILDRGQYDSPTDEVSPGVPAVLPAMSAEGRANRLHLANWMTRDDNPLTARVAVNRIWQIFFGKGIVSTTADFGSQGEWPSHPELLDWLAADFMASGWDQKELIRKLVSTRTYRQSSEVSPELMELDPQNRLLARGPRFRLAAEFVRDQALATSGLLVPRIGGPSVQPYQPAGLWKEVSHFGSTPATLQVFVQDKGEKLYRRSLYSVVKRTSPHPAMAAFDAPNREMCITERGVTNTPLQALVTLNDPQFAEAARVLAARVMADESLTADRARVDKVFSLMLSRAATESEFTTLSGFLTEERKRFRDAPLDALGVISVGESPVVQPVAAEELAAWTQLVALVMNLSETLTRN